MYSSRGMPLTNWLASKLGADSMHSTSPVRQSIITAAPELLPNISSARFWMSASSDSTTSLPGIGGTSPRGSLRTTRPRESTSTFWPPALPRSSWSSDFSTPALPMRKPGCNSTGSVRGSSFFMSSAETRET